MINNSEDGPCFMRVCSSCRWLWNPIFIKPGLTIRNFYSMQSCCPYCVSATYFSAAMKPEILLATVCFRACFPPLYPATTYVFGA